MQAAVPVQTRYKRQLLADCFSVLKSNELFTPTNTKQLMKREGGAQKLGIKVPHQCGNMHTL